MADVVEINEIHQLEQYHLAWQALLPQTPRASFFHTLDWLQLYWNHFGKGQKLRVLVVRSQGEVIGIVPLCVRSEPTHLGTIRVLTYPLDDWGMWYGPIGADQAATLQTAVRHIQNASRDWDMIDLRWSQATDDYSFAAKAFEGIGWSAQAIPYQQCALIDTGGTDYETYHATRSKKWRHESGRQARVLARQGEVTFERHRPEAATAGDGAPRWELYEDCLRIAEKSWQAGSTTGNTLSHTRVREFLRESHALAARLGMLDVAILKLDGQAVAYQYNYHYHGDIFGLRMGFDRDYSKYSVGKVLLVKMIEDSFSRRDMNMNLGVGDYDYKHRYQTGSETSTRVTYYPHLAWRPQGVRLSRWIKQRWAKPNAQAKASSATRQGA